jgi:hypothetical protein
VLKTIEEIKELAVETIENEMGAIKGLKKSINDDFVSCVYY